MIHEKWKDSASGYQCKIVKFGQDRFKAIAVSPDGKNELSIERRNRHIAKRDIESAIQNKINRILVKEYSEIKKIKDAQISTPNEPTRKAEKQSPGNIPYLPPDKYKNITAYIGLQFFIRGNFYQNNEITPGRVDFLKEPYNRHDRNAIAVVQEEELSSDAKDASSVKRIRKKVGYIPREMVRDIKFYSAIDSLFGWVNSSHQISLYAKGDERQLNHPEEKEFKSESERGSVVSLTDEQKAIINSSQKINILKIEALAGTGKTTTLKHIAEKNPKSKILYLAFNRDIADEARLKFPDNVTVKTSHSLAYLSVGFRYKSRLSDQILTHKIAYDIGVEIPVSSINESAYIEVVNDAVKEFLNSASREIWPDNIEKLLGEARGNFPDMSNDDIEIICLYACDLANEVFRELIKLKNDYPITHDVYFKVWQLSMPTLGYDIVLLDEAQDANPALLAVIQEQKKARKIYVGDRFQQIYSWRGATNAMTVLEGEVFYLTNSFRFGQKIADLANIVLSRLGSDVTLVGNKNESIVSRQPSHDCDAYIFRTNYGLIKTLLASRQKVRVAGGTKTLIETIQMVASIANSSRSREAYGFKTWQDFVEYSKKDQGKKYQFAIKIVEEGQINHSLSILKEADANADSGRFDCVYTTVHKAKGKEWNTVKIGGDFRDSEDPSWTEEEDRLLYVAITRAVHKVDITECFRTL